jgi:heme-degrading monooxygenase HmoA
MPGFVSSKDFTADDGERVSIIEFDSAEALEAWRVQSDHWAAQQQGRHEYYEEYSLQVCDLVRQSTFKRAP